MTTTLNASNSGSGGLVATADASGVLALQTAGTTAVTVSASQVVTLANALAVASGGTGVTSSTGTGSVVLSTSPTLITPLLGTPTSGTLTNCTFPTLNQNTTGSAATVTGNATGSTFGFNSGYGSVATAYGCRAWVNFNGTGTVAIRASGNVTSLTDNGTGDYTVNFTTAMPDANYSPQITAQYDQAGSDTNSPQVGAYRSAAALSTGSFRLVASDRASSVVALDPTGVYVAIFR